VVPEAMLDEKAASIVLFMAGWATQTHETSAREIELWVKHVGPYWGTPQIQNGLIAFYESMLAEGLHSSVEQRWIEEIDRFFAAWRQLP
jgi:hypothetical protein